MSESLFSQNTKNNYFPALTGIRAFAAFSVYLHHFNPFSENTILFNIVHEFHVSLPIFYVLSGFLICYRYIDSFKISGHWFKEYMLNRFARIYPIYFLLTILTFLEYVRGGINTGLIFQFLLNLTLLKAFFSEYKFSGISQAWSLTVEESFYLAAPFIFFMLKRNKLYLILIPAILISIGFILVTIFSRIDFYSFFSSSELMLLYTFFGRCVEFIVGAGLAILIKSDSLRAYIPKLPFITISGFLGIFFCIIAMAYLKGDLPFGLYHPVGIVLNNFVLPFFISYLFIGLLFEKTIFKSILETPLFNLLGKSSYVFYLIHMGFISSFVYKYITSNGLLIFIILNFIAIGLYSFIEEPLNRKIRRRFHQVKPLVLHNA